MTFLATDDTQQRQTTQQLGLGPGLITVGGPATFEGFGTALGAGIGRGLAATGGALYEAGQKVSPFLPFGPSESVFDMTGLGDAYRDADKTIRESIANAVESYRPDPQTTGAAGNLAYGVTSTLVPVTIGTVVAGPLGGAVAAGGATGYGTYTDLTAEGVDPETARGAATIEGVVTGVSVLLPASFGGNLLTRVGTGAALNVATGVGERAAMSSYLDGQGYAEIAERYQPFDRAAVAVDLVLGGAFGALPTGNGGEGVSPRADAARPSVEQVDAALVLNSSKHAEVDVAPGLPVDAASRVAHIRAEDTAVQQLLAGEPVNVDGLVRDARFIEKPPLPGADDATILKALRESGYEDLAAQVRGLEADLAARGRKVEDDNLPAVGDRRVDQNELQRLSDLRAERRQRSLTPAEADELLTLEHRDRLAAKVAGRRIPGVLNMEARHEAETAGQLLPVQGFADADNFKRINDELGHEVGDQAIATIGRAFAEALGEGNVFHRGGDEFVLQARTPRQFRTAMEAVRARLAEAELVATREDGTTVSRRGLRFSYGEGKTVKEAEHAQYRDKEARKAAGLRTDRTAEPTADTGGAGSRMGEGRPENRPGGDQAAETVTEQQAAEVVAEDPNLSVVDEAGQVEDASAMLAQADEGIDSAQELAPGFQAAVNCFLRSGG